MNVSASAGTIITTASGGTNAPASLTLLQLKNIYLCKTTNWDKVGGTAGTIDAFIPQSGSGTRNTFLLALGGGVTPITPGSCVSDLPTQADPGGTLEENEGINPALNDINAIFPYSIGAFVSQAYRSAPVHADGITCTPAGAENKFGCDYHGVLTLDEINGSKPTNTFPLPAFPTPPAINSAMTINTHFTAAFDRMRTGMQKSQLEQKALEERLRQAHKMEAVGRLAGGVAHDFNNLLTIIRGHSDLLLDRGQLDDAQRHNLDQIQKAAGKAVTMTRQLLAFSRMQVLQPRVLDLNAIVTDLGKMLPRLIGEDIEYIFAPDPKLAPVKADPGQIEQALMNLVVNSRDAMPNGGTITVRTRNVVIDKDEAQHRAPMLPGEYVLLSVSDTGTGMSPEIKAHIFEPFFTTKEVGKGTGLGLATVYGVVKQSGGFVWVESTLGEGATFPGGWIFRTKRSRRSA